MMPSVTVLLVQLSRVRSTGEWTPTAGRHSLLQPSERFALLHRRRAGTSGTRYLLNLPPRGDAGTMLHEQVSTTPDHRRSTHWRQPAASTREADEVTHYGAECMLLDYRCVCACVSMHQRGGCAALHLQFSARMLYPSRRHNWSAC